MLLVSEDNFFTGPIPEEIGHLTDLEVLDLGMSIIASGTESLSHHSSPNNSVLVTIPPFSIQQFRTGPTEISRNVEQPKITSSRS